MTSSGAQTSADAYAVFCGDALLRCGPLAEALAAVKAALDLGDARPILIFETATGRQVDFDLRGGLAEILARAQQSQAKGRGRPRLGVEGREVTLLPRHWAWLEDQPNGISATLRRLVEDASRRDPEAARLRKAQEAAYRFLQAMAGDRPNFEEACRALFAGDTPRLEALTQDWPRDVRAHLARMLAPPAQDIAP